MNTGQGKTEKKSSSYKTWSSIFSYGWPLILLILFWDSSSYVNLDSGPNLYSVTSLGHSSLILLKAGAHFLFTERLFSCHYFRVVTGRSVFTEEEGKGCSANVGIFSQVRAQNVPYVWSTLIYIHTGIASENDWSFIKMVLKISST